MDKSTLDAAFYNSIMSLNKKRYELCNSTFSITEQHYAQIHPDYRVDAREYAKRAYASDVTVLRWQTKIKPLIYLLFWGTLSAIRK